MNSMPPIFVASLFREICQHLFVLLSDLNDGEWHLPTVSSQRNVKDIASHLLDGSLRRLSMQRDGYFPQDGSSRPSQTESLMDFLNRLNADWERATRRLSPRVLVTFMQSADAQLADLFESLDPFGPAIFPVAWAGEEQSQNWMDVARDYTEKWHHTQQIFEATGRESTILQRHLYHPCLDIFMRALPCTYHQIDAPVGTEIAIQIDGEAGGQWCLQRTNASWRQQAVLTNRSNASVRMNQATAWKLFTKRLTYAAAIAKFPDIQIEGNVRLAVPAIEMVSVMA